MKNEFVQTENVTQFSAICDELVGPGGRIGPSLAMVTGKAGRGKTFAAQKYAANESAAYIPPLNTRTPTMVLREITFELAGMRPTRSDACLSIISEEMARMRRLIIIDEADLLAMQILEMLRNLNERYDCPVLLIGEDELKGKVASRRRISSRIRRRLEFNPVTQADVVFFFRQSLGTALSPEPAAALLRRSNGDWRNILTAAIAIERAVKASDISEITLELVNDVVEGN